jgi:hypothetical protein
MAKLPENTSSSAPAKPHASETVKPNKWRLFDRLTVGGTEHSMSGATISVSANGTSTVSTADLKKVVFKRFAEMNQVAPEVEKSEEG